MVARHRGLYLRQWRLTLCQINCNDSMDIKTNTV